MARLTARIVRLEKALPGAGARERAHLSEAELDARICRSAEKLTGYWRDAGKSVAAMQAEFSWPADDPRIVALIAEAQAPAFDAKRFLAAALGRAAESDEPK